MPLQSAKLLWWAGKNVTKAGEGKNRRVQKGKERTLEEEYKGAKRKREEGK